MQNKCTFSNEGSKPTNIIRNNIVEDQRFKPEINWDGTFNHNTSVEKKTQEGNPNHPDKELCKKAKEKIFHEG